MSQIVQMLKLLRPYWKYISQALLVSILTMILQIPGPYFTKILIDDVYPNKDWNLLSFALLLGAAISMGLGGMGFLSNYFAQCVSLKIGWDFQSSFYKHVQSLNFSFFDGRETGEIISRFGDMRASVSSMIGITNTFIMNSLQLLIFPPILFFINWKLALISMAVLPLDTALVMVSRKYLKRFSEKLAKQSAELSAKTYESINGIRTVQALGLETGFYGKLEKLLTKIARLSVRSAVFQGGTGLIGGIINTGGTLAYSWYGWSQILKGNLTIGSFMAFTAYVGYLYGPIKRLIGLIRTVEVTLVHTERFFEVYNIRPEIRDSIEAPRLIVREGRLEFKDVHFSYDGKNEVLKGINLMVEPGQTTALIGKSGSGKSTLAKLIPRFYDPTYGIVSIDGQNTRQVRLKTLRKEIGFALQNSTIFHGSVMENLTLHRNLPAHSVAEAAEVAYIHEFITSLPKGYDTLVGEQGVRFSEGQKQRIALARVLLMNKPILILDEPTANLDEESNYNVHKALKTIQERRTILIIAHQFSTIRQADQIAVMEMGEIVEQGTHHNLYEKGGHYFRICDSLREE